MLLGKCKLKTWLKTSTYHKNGSDFKRLTIPSVGEDVEIPEPSQTADWNITWHSHFEKEFDSFWKVKHTLTIWLRYSTLRCLYERNENKDLYTNVHRSVIHNSPKLETTQSSPNWWILSMRYEMNQTLMPSYNDMLLSNKKEWTSNTCNNIDEPKKHVKWKKPDTKVHTLYDLIYIKCPE